MTDVTHVLARCADLSARARRGDYPSCERSIVGQRGNLEDLFFPPVKRQFSNYASSYFRNAQHLSFALWFSFSPSANLVAAESRDGDLRCASSMCNYKGKDKLVTYKMLINVTLRLNTKRLQRKRKGASARLVITLILGPVRARVRCIDRRRRRPRRRILTKAYARSYTRAAINYLLIVTRTQMALSGKRV